jgi:hypothetical protein
MLKRDYARRPYVHWCRWTTENRRAKKLLTQDGLTPEQLRSAVEQALEHPLTAWVYVEFDDVTGEG